MTVVVLVLVVLASIKEEHAGLVGVSMKRMLRLWAYRTILYYMWYQVAPDSPRGAC